MVDVAARSIVLHVCEVNVQVVIRRLVMKVDAQLGVRYSVSL